MIILVKIVFDYIVYITYHVEDQYQSNHPIDYQGMFHSIYLIMSMNIR